MSHSEAAQMWVGDTAPSTTRNNATANGATSATSSNAQQPSTLTFTCVKVSPLPSHPPPSALSQILASKASKADNLFSELYALILLHSNPLSLEVIYPFSAVPMKPVMLKVRADATVEEVIGFALWTYWEEGLELKLDDAIDGPDDPRRKDNLSATGWSLHITEDGKVDDDFPGVSHWHACPANCSPSCSHGPYGKDDKIQL